MLMEVSVKLWSEIIFVMKYILYFTGGNIYNYGNCLPVLSSSCLSPIFAVHISYHISSIFISLFAVYLKMLFVVWFVYRRMVG